MENTKQPPPSSKESSWKANLAKCLEAFDQGGREALRSQLDQMYQVPKTIRTKRKFGIIERLDG